MPSLKPTTKNREDHEGGLKEKRVSEIEVRERCRELRDESFGVLREWERMLIFRSFVSLVIIVSFDIF